MTRNLQRDRKRAAACQQRLFRNQMEKLFLSLLPSISQWPRYFCSLKSLAKHGPYLYVLSSLKGKKGKNPVVGFSSLHFPQPEPCFPSKILFLQPNISSFSLHLISFPVFSAFIHQPPQQPLIFSLLLIKQWIALFPNISSYLDLCLMHSLASKIILGIFDEGLILT